MDPRTTDDCFHFDAFALRPSRRLLLKDGSPVPLGSRALELLIALVERAGEVLSRCELEARAWPRTVVEETSLRVHVSRLRKALGDGDGGARYILNVPGRGYVFVAPVASESGHPTAAPRASQASQADRAVPPRLRLVSVGFDG